MKSIHMIDQHIVLRTKKNSVQFQEYKPRSREFSTLKCQSHFHNYLESFQIYDHLKNRKISVKLNFYFLSLLGLFQFNFRTQKAVLIKKLDQGIKDLKYFEFKPNNLQFEFQIFVFIGVIKQQQNGYIWIFKNQKFVQELLIENVSQILILYFKAIKEEFKLLTLSSNNKVLCEIDVKKDKEGQFVSIQNRIFDFNDFFIKGMFFEPQDLCLFLKEECSEEKLLVFYAFNSEENPFSEPQEVFHYNRETEPLEIKFLQELCIVISYKEVTFYDKEFAVIKKHRNLTPNFVSHLVLENTILLANEQEIHHYSPMEECQKVLSYNKKEPHIAMILPDRIFLFSTNQSNESPEVYCHTHSGNFIQLISLLSLTQNKKH